MFLLSKFFPKLAHNRGRAEDEKVPCLGDKPKDYSVRVLLLDDSELTTPAKSTTKGQVILNKVYEHLNLIEREYFGLRYLDQTNQTHWLDPLKSIGTQLLKNGQHQYTLYFGVKFYAADPCKLHEEITRYQFFQQVKRDILQGRLPVSFDTAAELCSFVVQSEVGDYDPKRHSYGYVSEFRFVPNQTEELETRIMQLHKQMPNMVPSVAEYKFLDRVKWLEMYGVDLHPVQGEGSMEYFVGLTPTGIVVYRNKSKVGNYFWPRISKVTFKGKMFMLRVKDKNSDENSYAFECCTKQACKHLWKCCIEHHSFFRSAPLRIENYLESFRLSQANHSSSGPGKIFSLGSKHRYSGRTERQALADALNRPAPQVVRTPSKRHHRRASLDNGQLAGYPAISASGHMDGPITTIVTPEPVKTPSEQRKHLPAPDSPRSTRSAPWESGHHRKGGLYTSGRDSPMSCRSEKMLFPKHSRTQSGSESESGNHRHRRRESDNESEVSAKRHRRRRDRGGAASEGELEATSEREARRAARHARRSAENLPLSEDKWNDIQRRIRDGTYGTPYDTGRELRPNGSINSMPGSEASAQQRRRRRRSRSPGNKKPPEELAQHFRYVDQDPGLTNDQLRDIPYTKVETTAQPPRVRAAAHQSRHRHRSPNRRKSYGEESHASQRSVGGLLPHEEPPPPYSAPPTSGVQYHQHPPPHHLQQQQQPTQQQLQHQQHYLQHQQQLHHFQQHQQQKQHSYHPHQQYNNNMYRPEGEEGVRPPVSVYRNEAHTAPIVKTKPVAVYGGSVGGQPHAFTQIPQQQTQLHSPNQRNIQHSRDDSGLGFDQPDMSHQDRHFNKRSSAFEPLSGGLHNNNDAGYHSNLTNYHDTRSLTSLKSDPYRFYYTIDPRSRAPSSHSIASSNSHSHSTHHQPQVYPSSPGARSANASGYKNVPKPMYVEQVSSEPSPRHHPQIPHHQPNNSRMLPPGVNMPTPRSALPNRPTGGAATPGGGGPAAGTHPVAKGYEHYVNPMLAPHINNNNANTNASPMMTNQNNSPVLMNNSIQNSYHQSPLKQALRNRNNLMTEL